MYEYGTFEKAKVHRGYFQVDISLNTKHESFKEDDKKEWSTEAYKSIGDAIEGLHKEGEVLVKKSEGSRLVESGEREEEDSGLPTFYVIDPTNHAVAVLDVKFHDYSEETMH